MLAILFLDRSTELVKLIYQCMLNKYVSDVAIAKGQPKMFVYLSVSNEIPIETL